MSCLGEAGCVLRSRSARHTFSQAVLQAMPGMGPKCVTHTCPSSSSAAASRPYLYSMKRLNAADGPFQSPTTRSMLVSELLLPWRGGRTYVRQVPACGATGRRVQHTPCACINCKVQLGCMMQNSLGGRPPPCQKHCECFLFCSAAEQAVTRALTGRHVVLVQHSNRLGPADLQGAGKHTR